MGVHIYFIFLDTGAVGGDAYDHDVVYRCLFAMSIVAKQWIILSLQLDEQSPEKCSNEAKRSS